MKSELEGKETLIKNYISWDTFHLLPTIIMQPAWGLALPEPGVENMSWSAPFGPGSSSSTVVWTSFTYDYVFLEYLCFYYRVEFSSPTGK